VDRGRPRVSLSDSGTDVIPGPRSTGRTHLPTAAVGRVRVTLIVTSVLTAMWVLPDRIPDWVAETLAAPGRRQVADVLRESGLLMAFGGAIRRARLAIGPGPVLWALHRSLRVPASVRERSGSTWPPWPDATRDLHQLTMRRWPRSGPCAWPESFAPPLRRTRSWNSHSDGCGTVSAGRRSERAARFLTRGRVVQRPR